jgi:uncharacterized membrane protein
MTEATDMPVNAEIAKNAHSVQPPATREGVWTYRGYQLEASNFATAMVHFYRAEVTRANAARIRLDVTTNWAVLTTGAAISFAFGQPDTHHTVILLINVLITLFLLIETRRYRHYELWSYRVRLIETDFFAAMLVPPFHPSEEWSNKLGQSLLNPQFPISIWEAVGRRLRRNYVWIYLVLGIAWLAKLLYYPTGVNSFAEFIERSRIGLVRGEVVILIQLLFYAVLIIIGVATFQLQKATGEVLDRKADDIAHMASDIATLKHNSESVK